MDALEDFGQERRKHLQDLEKRAAGAETKNRLLRWVQWAVLLLLAGILLFQLPRVIGSLDQKERPLRKGTFATDARTDSCIQDLWQISRGLQEGKLPGPEMRCPASQKPYEIIRTEDDIIVRSPLPERYGYKEIRVSRKNPVPEIVR